MCSIFEPSPILGFWDIQQGYLLYRAVFTLISGEGCLYFFLICPGFSPMLREIIVRLNCNDFALELIYAKSSGSSSGTTVPYPPHPSSAGVGCEPAKIIVGFREGSQAILPLVTTDLICPNLSTDFSHGKYGESF